MRKLFIVPLILFVALAGCSGDLKAIAQAEASIPQAVTIIANTTKSLLQQGLISATEATKVSVILTDITNANIHAVTATQAIASLNSTTKPPIAAIVTPIIQEIQAAITSGDVYNIQNAQAKLTITTALTALVTTLQIIQAKVT